MDYIITTEQLTKKYKNFISVNKVSMHIQKGSIYGFLGPNGAFSGSPKILRIISRFSRPVIMSDWGCKLKTKERSIFYGLYYHNGAVDKEI